MLLPRKQIITRFHSDGGVDLDELSRQIQKPQNVSRHGDIGRPAIPIRESAFAILYADQLVVTLLQGRSSFRSKHGARVRRRRFIANVFLKELERHQTYEGRGSDLLGAAAGKFPDSAHGVQKVSQQVWINTNFGIN